MNLKSHFNKYADFFSRHSANGHFCYQRLTAFALIPLTFWLVVLLQKALNAPYREMLDWLSEPFTTMFVMAWLTMAIYHAALGVQVVIEDYVSTIPIRHLLIRTTNLLFLMIGILALLAFFIILIGK